MTLEDPRGPSVIAEAGEEKGQRQSRVTWERTPWPGDGGFRDGGRGRELRGAGGLGKPEKYWCLFYRKVFEVNTTGRRAAFILRLAAPLAPGGWGSPPRRLARLLCVPLKCHFCVKTTGARSGFTVALAELAGWAGSHPGLPGGLGSQPAGFQAVDVALIRPFPPH